MTEKGERRKKGGWNEDLRGKRKEEEQKSKEDRAVKEEE